ncbi:hypothetical protein CspeluHIS016_0300770 [Cutaneotrichosporon spelunceum]|uniref:U4/U6.U5 small nuclear ribonucleoprotein 27kDa protein domain-containing protein n=1 Tax=Cutaneotrichosporon spelunceum TaxID=1672016 RepID=A0AAD3TSU8_9TREE|nr:hypothetical protein CspeluHIS016_0300770 [Cutaneotrichosporon spelunceum]
MSARDEPPHRRPRSRSPVRRAERYDRDEVPRGEPRREREHDRDRGGGRDYRDRDRDRGDPYARDGHRDFDRGSRGGRGGHGGRGGYGGRYDGRDRDDRGGRRYDDRDDRGGRRYDDRDDRRGGRDRDREWDRDRPLDRRAIEEGRRRREEERARGVVFTEDGQKIEPKAEEPEEEAAAEDADIDDETRAMQAMMGFGGFGTTKGNEVDGNDVGTVKVNKKRAWRQYMNRRGGFNRALD